MNGVTNSGNTQVPIRIAVDIGGTFTDGVTQVGERGAIHTAKELTTPEDPSRAVADVVSKLLAQVQAAMGGAYRPDLQEVVHGTTLVTNAILERKGVKTGLLVTAGTADTLRIAREIRYDLYDIDIELPEPLVARECIIEITGRLDARGQEIESISPAALDAAVAAVRACGIESLGICLLHSYVNPQHEEVVGDYFRQAFPHLSISLSSRVAGEVREYERMSTVAANAYVQPIAETYLRKLRSSLEAVGPSAPLRIMVSSGGFTSVQAAADVPIVLLESGPAGGVLSALNTAALAGVRDVLTFDMGGTTAKACVATGGAPSITYLFEAARARRFKKGSGLPMLVPSIDLIEIGAGGGSIASRSVLGLLNVGPHSAGAVPGPACYGLGGTDPTVTDAALVLGYLDPENFLGGRMSLDKGRAMQAMERLGAQLGIAPLDVAVGICEIVNENMASAARVHVAEKGLDPRSLSMVATGGAGPVHAVEVANKLGIRHILCSIAAGVGSCLGFLAAPARSDRAWSRTQPLGDVDPVELAGVMAQLRSGAEAELATAGVPQQEMEFVLAADIRYAGQGHTVSVERPLADADAIDPSAFEAQFTQRYELLYGRTVPGGLAEVVTWRLSGRSRTTTREFRLPESRDAGSARPIATRSMYLPQLRRFSDVPVFDRYSLPGATRLSGPLLLQEAESTIVVAREAQVEILQDLTVSITIA